MAFIALLAFFLGITNSEAIVLLSKLTFSGCLILLPVILFGLWCENIWKYAAAVGILSGLVAYWVFSFPLKGVLYRLDPGIPSALLVTCVMLGFALKGRNGSAA